MVTRDPTFLESFAHDLDGKFPYWEDAVSFAFLFYEQTSALELCSSIETRELNQVSPDGAGVLVHTFRALQRKGRTCWPEKVYQTLNLIGLKHFLYYDFNLEMDKIERLQEYSQLSANKRLLFNLMESLETEEQVLLSEQLRRYLGATIRSPVKTMESLLLHLMSSHSMAEVCSILLQSLLALDQQELVSVFLSLPCGLPDCSVHVSRPDSSVPYYEQGPGLCVVINQKHFTAPDLPNRLGTDRDVAELKTTFTLLGVAEQDLIIFHDLKDTEILPSLETAAGRANSPELAWVAVVVLSHGKRVQGQDLIMGVNGRGVVREQMENIFSDPALCPNLTGKPKMFFYQACRVQEETSEELREAHPVSSCSPPSIGSSDVLTCSSTTAGTLSYRHVVDGSFFIRHLCEVLQDKAEEEHLEDLLKRVNGRVRGGTAAASQPVYNSTMSRQFRFRVTADNKARATEEKLRVKLFYLYLDEFVQEHQHQHS